MSRPTYQLTPDAHAQIVEIRDFIARENMPAALKVTDALQAAFELLGAMPGIGHTRADLTPRPLKFWRVYSYLVVYDGASDPIRIVAVVHGARDIGPLLTRLSTE